MSKKYIQTTLDFSSSLPDPDNNKVEKPDLKRKLSPDMGEPVRSYAKVASNHGSTSSHKNKNSTSQGRGHYTCNENKDKRHMKNEAEGSAWAGHSFTSNQSSYESRQQFPKDSDFRSDSQENAGPSSGFERSISQTSDKDTFPIKWKHEDSCDDSDDGFVPTNIEKDKPETPQEDKKIYRGVPLEDVKSEYYKQKNMSLPPLRPSAEHKVFFEVPRDGWKNELLKPYSAGATDTWNDDHVHMPYNSNSHFSENGRICSRWEKITRSLTRIIPGSFELEDAILSYNPHYQNRWNFDALHQFFEVSDEGRKMKERFFTKILPKIQQLALQLPELCPKAIPLLKQRKNMAISLSQQQIACLLANAFFCTFPRRNFKVKNGQLPDINFSNLYADSHGSRKFEKFRCIINYFERVTKSMPTGAVTYARQFVSASPCMWTKMTNSFTSLHVSTSGTIEDDGSGMLQADFANKYVGGGVLGHGLVQEEIRFLICPEMILSRLFTEVLTDNEVLIMTGCERFSNYEGYSDSFKWSGNHKDTTERDEWGRRYTEVVAMDALVIRGSYKSQFDQDKLYRELNKAYCAFKRNQFSNSWPVVCTGNWGCGAFGGDKQLKALIQMIAASAVDRSICYFTFGDSRLCDQMGEFYNILKANELTISAVLGFIKNYKDYLYGYNKTDLSLFEFIARLMSSSVDSPETNKATCNQISKGDGSSSSFEKYDSEEEIRNNTP